MIDEAAQESGFEPEGPTRQGRWRRFGGFVRRVWHVQPGPRVRKGAAWGAVAGAALAASVCGVWLRPGLGSPAGDVLVGILVTLLFFGLVGLALILALKLLNLLPRFLGWAGFAAVGVVALILTFLLGLSTLRGIALGIGVVCLQGAIGGALAILLGRSLNWAQRSALGMVVVAGVAADVYMAVWLADHGSGAPLVKVKAGPVVSVEPIAAADPSQPGPHRVLTLTYGSGTDRWRPEFGARAALKTRPVDATPFVTGNGGWEVRNRFWGFTYEEFPLNGRVWFPDGRGPFPLVLMVHGDHNMTEFSDPGYAYLGELFASRGFIAVSVDQNFFNEFWNGNLNQENDGRGWLLLKHLEVWRDWNRTPGNPFHGKVDLDRIALIGQSRGGEAAAHAALFNRLPRYPDDADIPLGFGFGIRAVAALAPSDGQYRPAGRMAPVTGVSYLVIQGGHDGDTPVFFGDRQYRRVELDPGRYTFKAELYSYRSNHGQFNTVWGDADAGWPGSFLLNRKALLDPEAQRRLAKVALSAFLEATLHDQRSYVRLFRDLRSARGWLPEDLYITRFMDSTFRTVADYQEDVDLTTASLAGATFEGRGLTLWRERDLPFRTAGLTKQNQVAFVGWVQGPARSGEEPAGPPLYALKLPQGQPPALTSGAASQLVFCLADADQQPPDPKQPGSENLSDSDETKFREELRKQREERKAWERKEGREPLDLTIELVAADGATARLPLSHFQALPMPLKSHFTKLADDAGQYGAAWEPVLQTFELPLAAFGPAFSPATLREIRFVFDRSPEGVVILDDVGFEEVDISSIR